MNWLGKRLSYRTKDHWYKLTRQAFLDNYGGGLLATVYNHSPLAALRDYKPNVDWLPWMLRSTPQSYWRDPMNRRAYMDWLGQKLRFKTAEDWYGLRQEHFRNHGGTGLLAIYYRNSPMAALEEYKPRIRWRHWNFRATPQGYWHDPENRKRYMRWLGKQLGYRKPEHWYQLRRRHFLEFDGAAMLRVIPGGSPHDAIRELFPDREWLEWMFVRVPNGYWELWDNRKRYLDWLGKEQGFRRKNDWYNLTREMIRETGGGAMLSIYYNNSLLKLLNDLIPNRKWEAKQLYNTQQLALFDYQ
ncbi:hypothetical protein ACERK3_17815 [Phycisphaerales bacterium AB-hyl4]|uniref:Uncharacterized protein n=1 Tax=Natronomicrosphaera hydrolytica TaxID=3242702 RepID=A0ABV4UB36_9BACT